MIHTHPEDPPFTAIEAARIARIIAVAVMRGGILTTAQEKTIDRIIGGARERADKAAAAARK